MAALLYRARALRKMSDVSYRNAMMYISRMGRRRDEPGQAGTVEFPSMLPAARTLLNQNGVSDEDLLSGSGIPMRTYKSVVSRTPLLTNATD